MWAEIRNAIIDRKRSEPEVGIWKIYSMNFHPSFLLGLVTSASPISLSYHATSHLSVLAGRFARDNNRWMEWNAERKRKFSISKRGNKVTRKVPFHCKWCLHFNSNFYLLFPIPFPNPYDATNLHLFLCTLSWASDKMHLLIRLSVAWEARVEININIKKIEG